jgi:hypothetical protein
MHLTRNSGMPGGAERRSWGELHEWAGSSTRQKKPPNPFVKNGFGSMFLRE